MIPGPLDELLGKTPPGWLRKLEATVLLRAFARAFSVEPPALGGMSPGAALSAYREFTAACMEAALEGGAASEVAYRARLGAEARKLGRRVRAIAPLQLPDAFRLVRFLYRGIGIELSGELPGALRFGPCSFAQRYTPADCRLMSAFDEGFICGACGIAGARGGLLFESRLTEGAPCCRARLG